MKKVLVANRGEIALRIMRSLKEMGIQTVAVYSEADRTAPHVFYADEAVCLGPAQSSQSYLLGDKIISVCIDLGVDGIHPGYGFLSENADFAKSVSDSGLVFIGPSPKAIQLMGDKLTAKATVKGYDIPMVPGTDEAIDDIEHARSLAQEIGFPILIKASAGGGGKGMRVVESADAFEEQMNLAVSEAVSAFGNGAVFIEQRLKDIKDIDNAIITLELTNGILCTIDSSRQTHFGYDQRIEVFGSEGMLSVENKSNNLYLLSGKTKTSKSKINESFIERYESSYLSELEYFYKSIINKSKSTVGPENILNAIRVASAGNESIKTNKPVLVEK